MSYYSCGVFSYTLDGIDKLLAPFEQQSEPGSPFTVFGDDEKAGIDVITMRRGYWYNPNARWKQYTIGGQWSGLLHLKEHCRGYYDHLSPQDGQDQIVCGVCDRARVADCRFTIDERIYQSALNEWEDVVEGSKKSYLLRPDYPKYTAEYMRKQYVTKELYAEDEARRRPANFVTADGQWHGIGGAGNPSRNDGTLSGRQAYNAEFDAYMEYAARKNLFITIVELHI